MERIRHAQRQNINIIEKVAKDTAIDDEPNFAL